MQVQILDTGGNPAADITTATNAATYVNVGQAATTDATGYVAFHNVQDTTISLKATTADNSIAVDSLAGGSSLPVVMTPVSLLPPLPGGDGFDVNNGTSGWTGRTVKTISKRHSHILKREIGLTVFTDYSPDLQMAYKSFNLESKVLSVFLA